MVVSGTDSDSERSLSEDEQKRRRKQRKVSTCHFTCFEHLITFPFIQGHRRRGSDDDSEGRIKKKKKARKSKISEGLFKGSRGSVDKASFENVVATLDMYHHRIAKRGHLPPTVSMSMDTAA